MPFVWNPSDCSPSGLTFSGGNAIVTYSGAGFTNLVGRSLTSIAVGEDRTVSVKFNAFTSNADMAIGLANASQAITSGSYIGGPGNNSIGYWGNNAVQRNNGNLTAPGFTVSAGDIIDVIVSRSGGAGNNTVAFRKGATTPGTYALTTLGDSNVLYLMFDGYRNGDQFTIQPDASAAAPNLTLRGVG